MTQMFNTNLYITNNTTTTSTNILQIFMYYKQQIQQTNTPHMFNLFNKQQIAQYRTTNKDNTNTTSSEINKHIDIL